MAGSWIPASSNSKPDASRGRGSGLHPVLKPCRGFACAGSFACCNSFTIKTLNPMKSFEKRGAVWLSARSAAVLAAGVAAGLGWPGAVWAGEPGLGGVEAGVEVERRVLLGMGEPAGTTLTMVPMQGGMVHVNILHRMEGGVPVLSVHLDPSVPVLLPLAVSHRGSRFDGAQPWHGELDPSGRGMAFNRQYGFVLDGGSDPLAEGHGIRILQLAAHPELRVRLYRQNPATWEPMFGQGGSEGEFSWNLMMFHPAYALSGWVEGPVEAEYEAYVVDADGVRVGGAAGFTLRWEVVRGLVLVGPVKRAGEVEVGVVVPDAWAGDTLVLQRAEGPGGMSWADVAEGVAVAGGPQVLRDPAPPEGRAVYRVRATQP